MALKPKPFTTRLDPALIRSAKTAGVEADQRVQDIVDQALRLWLALRSGDVDAAKQLVAAIEGHPRPPSATIRQKEPRVLPTQG